jgi:hypothetical protein
MVNTAALHAGSSKIEQHYKVYQPLFITKNKLQPDYLTLCVTTSNNQKREALTLIKHVAGCLLCTQTELAQHIIINLKHKSL